MKFTQDFRAGDVVDLVVNGTREADLAMGKDRVFDDRITYVVDHVIRAETEVIIATLGGPVDPLPFFAIERGFFAIVRDDVLPELGSDLDEKVTDVPDHRKIPQDIVIRYEAVMDENSEEKEPPDDAGPTP